jgi:hypothetical protein
VGSLSCVDTTFVMYASFQIATEIRHLLRGNGEREGFSKKKRKKEKKRKKRKKERKKEGEKERREKRKERKKDRTWYYKRGKGCIKSI